MFQRTVQLWLAVCILSGTAWAADDPFAGKWKLDSSRSQFPPDTMKVVAAGTNKYTFIFSEPNSETIVADGTDQPGIFGTTFSVAVQGPRVWKVVRKKNGTTLISAIWTLSGDDRTLRDEYTEFRQDGSAFSVDYLYERKAGATGFAATWVSTSETFRTPYEMQIEPWESDGLSLVDLMARVDKSVKFDGQDYPNSGQNASPGMASSGRRLSDHHLEVTDKRQGKVRSTDDFELSPDLQTLTETQHHPDLANPIVMVFVRE